MTRPAPCHLTKPIEAHAYSRGALSTSGPVCNLGRVAWPHTSQVQSSRKLGHKMLLPRPGNSLDTNRDDIQVPEAK